MSDVIASSVLANGLRTDFWDTYAAVRNRIADSRLSKIMDLGISATNRETIFGYFNAAPHFEQWIRGQSIPTDGFDSVKFTVPVYTWGRRVKWHNEDREDDQTQSLFDVAKQAGQSAALLPERFFFDMLTGSTNILPATLTAPDGAAIFSTTDGSGAARFGVTNGNLVTGTGVASLSAILTDFYSTVTRFKGMQDGKGQPLWGDDVTDGEYLIIHGSANTEVFEQAFLQKRQGIVAGTDAGTTPSNIVQDASRNVKLWSTQRITDNDWFVFPLNVTKRPFFFLDRKGLQEESALRGENNSDLVRNTGEEYIQWYSRSGAGVVAPFGVCKVNN